MTSYHFGYGDWYLKRSDGEHSCCYYVEIASFEIAPQDTCYKLVSKRRLSWAAGADVSVASRDDVKIICFALAAIISADPVLAVVITSGDGGDVTHVSPSPVTYISNKTAKQARSYKHQGDLILSSGHLHYKTIGTTACHPIPKC